jgi:hypothetical protein
MCVATGGRALLNLMTASWPACSTSIPPPQIADACFLARLLGGPLAHPHFQKNPPRVSSSSSPFAAASRAGLPFSNPTTACAAPPQLLFVLLLELAGVLPGAPRPPCPRPEDIGVTHAVFVSVVRENTFPLFLIDVAARTSLPTGSTALDCSRGKHGGCSVDERSLGWGREAPRRVFTV